MYIKYHCDGTFNGHSGIICLIHLYCLDDNKINKTVLALTDLRKDLVKSKLVLVPHCYIGNQSEKKMDYTKTEKFLQSVANNLPNAVFLPYKKGIPFDLSSNPGSEVGSFEV